MLTVCSRTHQGNRPINEDATLWEPAIPLLAVADGMGGHNAGEIASSLALESVAGFLNKSATSDFTWPFGVQPTLSFAANRLITAIKIANRCVFKKSEERAAYTGMGTTVVAAILDGARLAYSGVGDSRLYLFDGTALKQMTTDDSWVAMLMKETKLDGAALEKHPMRHVLTSVVGARPDVDVVVDEADLQDGQIVVLTTDGLHNSVSDADIAAVLQAESNLEAAADRLIQMGLTGGATDNLSVALGRYSR